MGLRGAVDQAREIGAEPWIGAGMIVTANLIEAIGSLAVLSGIADRLAAVVLAGYRVATAVLCERWSAIPGHVFRAGSGDLRHASFFNSWKNLAVADGFGFIASGITASSQRELFEAPFASAHPYGVATP